MRNLEDENISGFSLAGALLTSGILLITLLDGLFFSIMSNVLITLSIAGFTLELNKIINDNTSRNGFISDIGVSMFLGVIIFWTWNILQELNWLNDWVKFFIIIISVFMFYALYRGIIGLIAIIMNSNQRIFSIEVFIQLGGLLVAFLALFFAS